MISCGIGKLGPKTDANGNIIKEGVLSTSDTKAMMIVGGGLLGGISSSIAGGDFMKGMQQGLITSGLNHAMHEVTSGWDQDPPKKTYNEMTPEERDYSYMKETLIPANEFLIDATLAIESAKGLWGLTSIVKIGWKSLGISSSVSSNVEFTVNPGKFDYFFCKIVTGSEHNISRSVQNLKDLNTLGIRTEAQLTKVFTKAFNNGTYIKTQTSQYGTTITKNIMVNKGGSIDVGFFYKDGNMMSQPSVVTIIPKIFKQ